MGGDRVVTERLIDALLLIDVRILDHVVIHKAEHIEERKLMLQWWADCLDVNRKGHAEYGQCLSTDSRNRQARAFYDAITVF